MRRKTLGTSLRTAIGRTWRKSPGKPVGKPQGTPVGKPGSGPSGKPLILAGALLGCGAYALGRRAGAAGVLRAKDRPIGRIEAVFSFWGSMPTGVSVDASGRIFVNFPRWGDPVPATVAEIVGSAIRPYPNAAINWADPARPAETLISVQSIVADGLNRLWILDTAAPSFGEPVAGGAKLLAVDLAPDRVVRTIVLPPEVVLPTTYLNDVRFDFRPGPRPEAGSAGVAYITDSSVRGPGALIVVDLATGAAWRRLSGHPSTQPDPSFVPIVEGEALLQRPPGGGSAPFRVAADGIALSADGETLYYCPLSSRHLYAVPTALLRDRAVADATVAARVVDLGEKGASDGLEADAEGRLYAGDYEHNSIRRRLPDGSWETIVHDPRVLWPDTLSVAHDGYLYFTVNQVQRQKQFHRGIDRRQKPYTLFRTRIGGTPICLR